MVDNGSSDGTVELIRSDFPWVTLIPSDENLGFAVANNIALRRARGEYLLLLNPDTQVPAGALVTAVAALDERPRIGMLGCKLVRPNGTLDHACKRGFPTPSASIFYFTGLSRLRPRSPRVARYTMGDLDPNRVGFVDAVNGAFMLVRRRALEEVGLMDERFWLYLEDLDWCYRFWQAGWPVLYWPRAEVVHVKGGSSTPYRSWRVNLAFHRSMWLFYRKHYERARPALVTAAVWSGIWLRFGLSTARNSLLGPAQRQLGFRLGDERNSGGP